MPVRINGATSGSVTLDAPATGSNVTLTLPGSVGTSGQLLSTNGAGVLSFVNGGKILQIVRATDSTNRTTTSTTMVDANISVTITPQKSDSAVLLIWSVSVDTPSGVITYLSITDSSNNSLTGGDTGELFGQSSRLILRQTVVAYATPATTSATTYKGRFRVSSGTAGLKNADIRGQLFALEVSA